MPRFKTLFLLFVFILFDSRSAFLFAEPLPARPAQGAAAVPVVLIDPNPANNPQPQVAAAPPQNPADKGPLMKEAPADNPKQNTPAQTQTTVQYDDKDHYQIDTKIEGDKTIVAISTRKDGDITDKQIGYIDKNGEEEALMRQVFYKWGNGVLIYYDEIIYNPDGSIKTIKSAYLKVPVPLPPLPRPAPPKPVT